MHDAIDEQGRCTSHLARRDSALDVSPNTRQDARARPVVRETCEFQLEQDGIALQIVVCEGSLAVEEQLVHGPEAALERSCLSCAGRRQRMWMDLRERVMPECEADAPGSCCSTRSISRNARRE
jgi:hypothetical protein